jgi:TrmH family RNA methyltransferase
MVLGTSMRGNNLYESPLQKNGLLIFGNEGSGITEELLCQIPQVVAIPCFSGIVGKPESLNVAMSVAVVCSEFRRRFLQG